MDPDLSIAGVRDQHANLAAYLPAIQAQWLAVGPDVRWRSVDATLVMADVSGFTPLAERLGRRGKVGAEDLTDVLNTVFRELLTDAAALGGDCLKFGGDALFLLFSGHGHAHRACAAADAMRRALIPGGTLSRALGTTKLQLSIGVHSGWCHLFLAGRVHEELVVCGPTVSQTLEMEGAAEAGEVLVSSATAAHLAESTLGARKGDGWLLDHVTEPPPCALARPPSGFAASDGVPVALRADLTGEPNEGEHRVATIAFVAFAGVDRLLEDDGPAAVAAAVDGLIIAVQEACQRWGVTFLSTDVNRDGGKIILASGVPRAVSEGEDRILHALHDVFSSPQRLTIRAGVNEGRVFAVDMGHEDRRTYTVMGDTVNLAARVAFTGTPGQVVATRAVLDHVRGSFDVDWLEPFTVKGKSMPIEAAVIGPARASQGEVAPNALPVVGRVRELAALRDTIARAHEGDGRIVELIGEAGIGKSRLVAEAVRMAHGLQIVSIEGGQYGQGTPYFALRAPLRQLIGVRAEDELQIVVGALTTAISSVAPHLLPWLPLIGVPFGLDLPDTSETAIVDAPFRRAKLHTATAELIEGLLTTPSVVVVEDAHWLDWGTTELLRMLAQNVGRKPWAVIVSRRDVPEGLIPPPGDVLTTFRLDPLDDTQSMALAVAVADEAPLPPHMLADLTARSGGNPLFLQELLATARRHGGTGDLPDGVEATIAAGIDVLAVDDRRALRSAAVLGARFSLSELAAMLGEDHDAQPDGRVARHRAITAADRLAHFLVPDGVDRLRFRHLLLREVAYEALSFRARRQLHSRAGNFRERAAGERAPESAELLSLHFHEARRFDRSWHYSRLAGERAQHGAALAEAAVFYQRSLEAARALRRIPDADVAEVAERLGDVCELSGRYEEAAAAYTRARQRLSDPVAIALLCKKEGWVRERSTRYSEALRWYGRGFRALETAPARGVDPDALLSCRIQLLLARGSSMIQQGRYRAGIPLVEEVAKLAEEQGDLATTGHACYLLDWALTDTGDPRREHYRERILSIYPLLDDDVRKGTAFNNLGANVYFEGRWDEALGYYGEAQRCRERIGDVVGRAMTVNNIGEILVDQGRFSEAEERFREALRVVRATGYPVGIGFALANLGRVATRTGRLSEAGELLVGARARFESAGAAEMVLETDAKEAERLLASHNVQAALALTERTLRRLAEQAGGNPLLPAFLHRLAGLAHWQLGQAAESRAGLEASLVAGRRVGADYEVACTLAAMAALTPDPAATAEAHSIFDRLGVVAPPPVYVSNVPS